MVVFVDRSVVETGVVTGAGAVGWWWGGPGGAGPVGKYPYAAAAG